MEYKKPVMKIKELEQIGLPREFLLKAFRDKNQDFAWKINPGAKNSPILFDTAGLEKYRVECIKNQRVINKRVGVM